MNRRNAISNIVVLSIGAVVLPSCGQQDKALVQLKNFSLTGNEEKLLVQLADTIIPKTNFPGAADLKLHEFILVMVDDCYEPDKQEKFMGGLKKFDQSAKQKYGSSFIALTPEQKAAWLSAMESKKEIPAEALFFYETTKRLLVQGFTTSKEYMTGVMNYKMVPGSDFKGCVPVKKA
ncbi:MAG: gluconate 2-dehydrogenase subunit 3 family protein [Ferruginibacter sp.]|nr:gluconate 2-dehydrogenase subunit 3 family protein [Ferruginibacter sp.]